MSGDRVEYRAPCPRCRQKGRDRSGDNLAVYDDGHSYCFSCHYLIPAPSIERLREASSQNKQGGPMPVRVSDGLKWPGDAMPIFNIAQVPIKALGWLRKYGITNEEITTHDFHWSWDEMLLLFPVYEEGRNMVMWQGRNFGDGPKYLTSGPKSDTLYRVGKAASDTIIVTEDLISAIKVGREYEAAPLWGAEMGLGLIKKVAGEYSNLGVWLDPDKTLQAVEIALRASQYIPTFVITSTRDPKEYGLEAITELVERHGTTKLWKEGVEKEEEAPIVVGPNPEPNNCIACKGSGRNSAGYPCTPCAVKGRIKLSRTEWEALNKHLVSKGYSRIQPKPENVILIESITYNDPNVIKYEDSIPTPKLAPWARVMRNIVDNQACTKCMTKSKEAKQTCPISGCPHFDSSKCEAGTACMKRTCENCLSEYGEACLKSVNSIPEHPEAKDYIYNYLKSSSGS